MTQNNFLDDANAGHVLTSLARHAIASSLRQPTNEAPTAEWLLQPGASFVTLTQSGQLRGCIGSLEAWRGLGADVTGNAMAAAFDDPRFAPLTARELPITDIEVSVLSPSQPMAFTSHQDALAQLRPGVDGIVLSVGHRRATFLPQVWDELPDPAQFMAHLMRKAGLPANYWSDDVKLSRYSVTAYQETQ